MSVKQTYVSISDQWGKHRLSYHWYGDRDAPRQIVCVHGLTRNAFDFAFLAQSLADHGYGVIVPDMIGRGGSSWLDDPQGYRVETYAGQMIALLDQLKLDRVDWIGTSMGGLIALEMAWADRFRSLILNDIGPFVPQTALQMIASYLALDLKFESVDAVEAHLRQIHAPFGDLSDSQWQHLATHSARQSGDNWCLHYDPEIRVNFGTEAQGDLDCWEQWSQIQCPTLIIRGSQSVLFDRDTMERMAASRSNVQTVEFDRVGHAPALMDDDQIRCVSDFLQSV